MNTSRPRSRVDGPTAAENGTGHRFRLTAAATAIHHRKEERAMTKAQEVYERIEALVASGVKKADAFRQLADEYDQEFNSIRGAYYAHTRSLGGSPRTPGNGTKQIDPVESAMHVLEKAIEAIDIQIEAAKERADLAKTEYEHLRDTAGERKKALQAKIDALKA